MNSAVSVPKKKDDVVYIAVYLLCAAVLLLVEVYRQWRIASGGIHLLRFKSAAYLT